MQTSAGCCSSASRPSSLSAPSADFDDNRQGSVPYPIYSINCISRAQRGGYHPAVPASPSPHPPCPRCKEIEGVKEAHLLEGTLRWFICRTCMHVWSLSPTARQTS